MITPPTETEIASNWLPKPRKSVTADLPDFVFRTNRVKVEPFYTASETIFAVIEGLGDGDFFTDAVSMLYRAYWPLYDRAWDTVPNPAYDKDRADEFCANHPTKCGTEFRIGQSYNPKVAK